MSRTPKSDGLMNMLMMQNMTRQADLAKEQAAYSASMEQQRQQAEANVRAQQAQMEADIKKKASTPVTLGTLMTSPNGLLGNPMLSSTKLSG